MLVQVPGLPPKQTKTWSNQHRGAGELPRRGRPMQRDKAAEPALPALREGTRSQVCPDQTNCTSSSPSRCDGAHGLWFHNARERGDILTHRLSSMGEGSRSWG